MTALHFLRQWTKSNDKEDKSRANEPKEPHSEHLLRILGGIATMLMLLGRSPSSTFWPWPFLNMPLLGLQLGYSLL